MSDTGPQPHQPTWRRLRAGEEPPQLVVISWDGGGETGRRLNSHFQAVAKELGASMTIFLSGIYFVPREKRMLYRPPGRPRGSSDINLFPESMVHSTIEQIGKAWLAGHEIGTHFNGHFCGPRGGSSWSVADWRSEIAQAEACVAQWRTNTGFTDLPSLPFDYRKELVGGRTPCLEGYENLRKAADELGWRYDSSNGRYAMWPKKVGGLWDLSMQTVPFAGTGREMLAMDYNFMVNQSKVTNGDPSQRAKWRKQTADSFVAGWRRSYEGNRSPVIIGNHFEQWNGGIYMDAVEEAMQTMAKAPDTHLVSMRQLCDWLDLQDPKVVERLATLDGKPPGGWDEYLQLT